MRLAYLHGSVARGDGHAASDIDLAVLMDDSSLAAYRALWSDLRDTIGAAPAFDLSTLNGASPLFCFEVIREGRVLYRRSVSDLNAFELRAGQRYRDTHHIRSIGDQYLEERARAWSSESKSSATG